MSKATFDIHFGLNDKALGRVHFDAMFMFRTTGNIRYLNTAAVYWRLIESRATNVKVSP